MSASVAVQIAQLPCVAYVCGASTQQTLERVLKETAQRFVKSVFSLCFEPGLLPGSFFSISPP